MNLAIKQLAKTRYKTSNNWRSVLESARNLDIWKMVEGMLNKKYTKINPVKWQKKIRSEWV